MNYNAVINQRHLVKEQVEAHHDSIFKRFHSVKRNKESHLHELTDSIAVNLSTAYTLYAEYVGAQNTSVLDCSEVGKAILIIYSSL